MFLHAMGAFNVQTMSHSTLEYQCAYPYIVDPALQGFKSSRAQHASLGVESEADMHLTVDIIDGCSYMQSSTEAAGYSYTVSAVFITSFTKHPSAGMLITPQ